MRTCYKRLLQKAKEVAVVMITQPCTLAQAPRAASSQTFSFFSFSRSANLRTSRHSIATMNLGGGEGLGGGGGARNLDPVFHEKKILRSKVKKDLRNMDSALRSQEDTAIQNIILESDWFKSSERLCAYISCAPLREADTSQILSHILCAPDKDEEGRTQNKKKLYVPRVEDKNCHMRMLNILKVDDMIANSMNILEPSPVDSDGNQREDVMQSSDPVDLFLLPGLAFDRSGRRLGRGGGYYDTFLRKYRELAVERKWKQPLLVALSYSVQILDEGVIPLTPNDMFIDALVSPTGVIPISPTALEKM